MSGAGDFVCDLTMRARSVVSIQKAKIAAHCTKLTKNFDNRCQQMRERELCQVYYLVIESTDAVPNPCSDIFRYEIEMIGFTNMGSDGHT
jgi:hypothetical protein